MEWVNGGGFSCVYGGVGLMDFGVALMAVWIYGFCGFLCVGGGSGVCSDGVLVVWVGFNVLGNLDPD